VSHETSALTQNFFYFSEWSTFLLDVRFGEMFLAPDLMRTGGALVIVGLIVSLEALDNLFLRWSLRIVAALPVLMLLPPYPQVLQLWWAEGYELRFLAASLIPAGLLAVVFLDRPGAWRRAALISGFSLAGMVIGVASFWRLKEPFEAHYTHGLSPGWGLALFLAGTLFTGCFGLWWGWRQKERG
jgi:hypothetical protein